MTRINTNVNSLVAQNRLNKSNNDLQTSLTRLSTGLRINSGKDDPAGLIASEALRSDITSINKAISNTQRANQIIATADSALGQVSSLLNDIRGLVVEAANNGALSDDEIAANQLQVDSSLEAINRIAQTTTFQGRRLLDGSLDFITKAGSGFNTVTDLKVDQANLGAAGAVAVDVNISAAASKASIVATGIPVATTAVKSSATLTFPSPTPAAEASGTINLATAFTIGAEANGTVTLANAFKPDAPASGTATLTGGAAFDIDALFDGTAGNVAVNITTSTTSGSTAGVYNAASNTLSLVLEEGLDGAAIASALNADTAINTSFSFSNGNADVVLDSDTLAAPLTLTGGTDLTSSSFLLSAVDGGAADGELGNATTLAFTSGASTSASYDTNLNRITLTVAAGATVSDIVSAINTDLAGNFTAANTVNGDFTYSITDNTAVGAPLTPLAGGDNPVAPAAFTLTAVNGGDADGTTGNSTVVNYATGDSTSASYDAATNQLNVIVGAGATVSDIVAAINTDGTFLANNTLNGQALFDVAAVGDSADTLSGGTDGIVNDVITVEADVADASFDGKSITLNADNSLAAGAAAASLDGDGNIVVRVSDQGAVSMGAIASAISQIDGFTASVTSQNGDGAYDIVNDDPAVATLTAGGVFGGGLSADLVLQLTGTTGSEVFQFKAGASLDSVIQSINLVADATSIRAENDAGNLKLSSTLFGSSSLVAIEVISEGTGGIFKENLTTSRSNGTDIQATVNGTAATGKGNTLSLNTATLDLSLTVQEGSSDSVQFSITGGGAQFQLGPNVVSNQQARLGIGSLNTAKLGSAAGRLYELASGGSKALATDATGASQVVDDVINKVTSLRGRLGAFQATTLESNLVSLNETVANLTEAESSIRDADFAAESARLTRAQILIQSGTSVLGIANQNPQNVLSLLR